MATLYAHPGDSIIIQGKEYVLESASRDSRYSSDIGDVLDQAGLPDVMYVLRTTPLCVACSDNIVDERGDVCPGCMMHVMRLVALRGAVEKLIEEDDIVGHVVEWDNANAADAHKKGMQYIDLVSGTKDQYEGTTHEAFASDIDLEKKNLDRGMRDWVSDVHAR